MKLETVCKMGNKWTISGTLIVWELCLIKVQTMEVTWWWHNLLFQETSIEMDVKTVNVIVKTNRQQFSMVCNLIHHRNDIKMFKTLHWNQFPVVLGSTWVLTILMSFLWPTRQCTDHGKLMSINLLNWFKSNAWLFFFTLCASNTVVFSADNISSKNACYYLTNLSHYIQRICIFHCCFLNL